MDDSATVTTENTEDQIIVEEWVTRQQAGEILKISDRSVQRYASAGEIRVEHRKRAGGSTEAYYSKLDILKLKHRLDNPQPKPATTALARTGSQQLAPSKPEPAEPAEPERKRRKPEVRTAERLILTVVEVVALTQLSEDEIRADLKSGKLKGFTRGRRWRIKRRDLDAYIEQLS